MVTASRALADADGSRFGPSSLLASPPAQASRRANPLLIFVSGVGRLGLATTFPPSWMFHHWRNGGSSWSPYLLAVQNATPIIPRCPISPLQHLVWTVFMTAMVAGGFWAGRVPMTTGPFLQRFLGKVPSGASLAGRPGSMRNQAAGITGRRWDRPSSLVAE